MPVETLSSHDLSRIPHAADSSHLINRTPPPYVDQHCTSPDSLWYRKDGSGSKERTPKTFKEYKRIVKKFSQRPLLSSIYRRDSSKAQGIYGLYTDSALLKTLVERHQQTWEIEKWRNSVPGGSSQISRDDIVSERSSDESPHISNSQVVRNQVDRLLLDQHNGDKSLRPALRQPCKKPTCMKSVHFTPKLVEVCHFYGGDCPLAITSTPNSSDHCWQDTNPSFSHYEWPCRRASSYYWAISTPNFPKDVKPHHSKPIKLGFIELSTEMLLTGCVTVANWRYRKSVFCRFTMDYWKTISETKAIYTRGLHNSHHDQDEFVFTIDLSEATDLEYKPMFLCICYEVGGREFWDNNSGANFQVDFLKIGKKEQIV